MLSSGNLSEVYAGGQRAGGGPCLFTCLIPLWEPIRFLPRSAAGPA